MNTTLLFAELLIIGLQSIVWILILATIILGTNWFEELNNIGLANWQAVIAIVLLSILYLFGILVDRVADKLFDNKENRIKDQILPDLPHSPWVIRFLIAKDNERLNQSFDYNRSRGRIVRAAILNFGLSSILLIILLITRIATLDYATKLLIVFFMVICILITALSFFSWILLTRAFYKGIKGNYAVFLNPLPKKSDNTVTTTAESKENDEP